jgi:DNA-directed RNA polymerase specialized sigma24 family protein
MSDRAFHAALVVLRETSGNGGTEPLAIAAMPLVRRAVRRARPMDEDDATQEALVRVITRWRSCRGATPRESAAWVRCVARRVALDQRRRADRYERLGDEVIDESAQARPLMQLALVVAGDAAIAPAPGAAAATMRRLHVAAKPEGRERDLAVLRALRVEGRPALQVADQFGLLPAAARKSAERGAAALGVGAALAMASTRDALLRDALAEIAEWAGVTERLAS